MAHLLSHYHEIFVQCNKRSKLDSFRRRSELLRLPLPATTGSSGPSHHLQRIHRRAPLAVITVWSPGNHGHVVSFNLSSRRRRHDIFRQLPGEQHGTSYLVREAVPVT